MGEEVTYLVGVYGTLKKGNGNHDLMQYACAEFVANAKTLRPMRLCITGLPFLIKGEHEEGHLVQMELYFVGEDGLKILDALEGHPHFYEREKLEVVTADGEQMTPWVYQVGEEYDKSIYYEKY
jgi:gamma-glutamylaminecyclotransferase